MDVIMPNKDGVDACRDIMELLPETRVLMLTASTEEDAVIEAVAAGATGYLQKYSRPEELVEAVLDVAKGRLRIPGEVVREVFAIVRSDRKFAARQTSLQDPSLVDNWAPASLSAPTPAGAGSSPSGTPRPDRVSAL